MPDFTWCLNTSTIRPAGLLQKIKVAAKAGYAAIELWLADVEEHLAAGGKLSEVLHALDDAGLARPSAVSLKDWCLPAGPDLKSAWDTAQRRLELAARLGIQRIIAGPPREAVSRDLVAERYAQLLELSLGFGVPASLEFLGFVASVSTLEAAWEIARACPQPQRSVTLDAWHIFRGGTAPAALDCLPANAVAIVHWNDAPPRPPREQQTDAHRVMPGDGVLNLRGLAERLRAKGWSGALSLELFNEHYWRRDPLDVACLGLAKMRASVESVPPAR